MSVSTRHFGYTQTPLVTGIAVGITLLSVGYFFFGFSPFSIFSASSDGDSEGRVVDFEESAVEIDRNGSTGRSPGYFVYFGNSKVGDTLDCAQTAPVVRSISGVGKEAGLLLALFSGPSKEEEEQGFNSPFSDETAVLFKSITIRNGIAAVNIADVSKLIPGVSSSCGSESFVSSVENTLQQFDAIDKVVFAIDGDSRKFYELIQIGCNEDNFFCDNSYFH